MKIDELVARGGDLKRDLVAFAEQPQLHEEFERAAAAAGFAPHLADEYEIIEFLDTFVLQHRFDNGQTVVERFVDTRPELTDDERHMLLGWREVVEGYFEVHGRDGDALLVVNLIDELPYRVYSNMGPGIFRRMRRRSFLLARLVPVGDHWMISGVCRPLPVGARVAVYRAAAMTAARHPRLVFRNPEFLALGWQLQHAERERFVRFFGRDLVVLASDQAASRLEEYQRFSAQQVLAGLPGDQPELAPVIRVDLGEAMLDAETIGVIYDEVEGLNLYADFGLVEAVFAEPALLRRRRHRQQLLEYLDDDSVSPLPLRRLAERDPARAGTVFARLLRRRGFDWGRDGEALLREYKPAFFDTPVLPSVTPINDRLVPYLRQS